MDVMNEIKADMEEISRKVPKKVVRKRKRSNKNDIMIGRVIRALKTDDPDAIAKKITSSTNILNQTDFKDYDDVMEYLKNDKRQAR